MAKTAQTELESDAGRAPLMASPEDVGRSPPEKGGWGPRLERLLTVDQLAEIWQLHPRTIRRMIANGQIPVQRFGRAVRIHPKVARRAT